MIILAAHPLFTPFLSYEMSEAREAKSAHRSVKGSRRSDGSTYQTLSTELEHDIGLGEIKESVYPSTAENRDN